MHEYTASHFEELCRDAAIAEEIGAIETKRRHGLRRFWLLLAGSLVLGLLVLVSLMGSGWPVAAMFLAVAVVALGIYIGSRPLTAAKQDLKHPVLETLAARGGMEYLPSGFDPPVYPSAGKLLFGGISSYVFTDLFHGTDAEGHRFAVYEGTLTRRQGKNTVTVFSGQLYAFQRRSRGSGEIAIVPDKGLFNFIKPRGMDRVKFDSDPAFEKKFEVYSDQVPSATAIVGTDVRRQLLELRQTGRVFAYVGPEDVLVAHAGGDRFEPGSMFRARSGEERAKMMFDDLCAAMNVLRQLKRVLD